MAFFNPYQGGMGNLYPAQNQPVMQNTFMPIVVKGKEEAENYLMAANTTISMVDPTMTHLWVKSTNASGTVVLFDTYNLSKVVEEKPQYATKKDFDELKAMIESLAAGGKQQ